MPADPFAAFAPRPPDVPEWEELLVKLDLAPRALRFTLEDGGAGGVSALGSAVAGGGAPGAVPGGGETENVALAAEVARLAAREEEAWTWLRALHAGEPLAPWAEPEDAHGSPAAAPAGAAPSLDEEYRRFVRLRARNFAWVQRRGIDVWEWASPHPEYGEVTAHQLLSYLVKHDGRRLARIRELAGAGRVAC